MSAAPIRSMTGYASTQSATEEGVAFMLSLKSVNHRFLDLSIRLPGECDGLEIALRKLIKERVKRGHLDVMLHVERRPREAVQTVQVNHDLLSEYVQAFHDAAKQHRFNAEPDLHELLRMPGVLTSETPAGGPDPARAAAIEAAVMALAPGLLDQLNQMREAEGAALATELEASMLRLRKLAEECAALRAGAREAHFERLRTRVVELLRSSNEVEAAGQVTEQRLLAEAALLVERSDIEEELVRLRAHIESFMEMLQGGGELGKRLDFLLQELNREGNTLLSKTTGGDPGTGLRLTTLGLEVKAEIERAREQVQNLE
ncbi:MAG TPA: YicC/YloC family endoribonuclease [Acidobacteriaceae bacterium]|nr:YicC/YloC family endoribonuclease [Acidobacteriaceae bacterium]